jgi:hypothetical protein
MALAFPVPSIQSEPFPDFPENNMHFFPLQIKPEKLFHIILAHFQTEGRKKGASENFRKIFNKPDISSCFLYLANFR